MDINQILFLIAILNMAGDLYTVIRFWSRVAQPVKVVAVSAMSSCILAWIIVPDISGYIAVCVFVVYLYVMRRMLRPAGSSVIRRPAPLTWSLIGANCLAYLFQWYNGATSDPIALVQIGALFGPLVQAGQWWRLISAQFLHFGVLHLACNMFGLKILGPQVEQFFGRARYLVIYFLSGTGGLAIGWAAQAIFSHRGPGILLGASASVLGLVGATAASSFVVYKRSGSILAKERSAAMVQIVAMQMIFDSLVPEVSSTAHVGGAAIGFGVGLALSKRIN